MRLQQPRTTQARPKNGRRAGRAAGRATKSKRDFSLPFTSGMASNPYTTNATGGQSGVPFTSKTNISTTGSRMLVPLSATGNKRARPRPANPRNGPRPANPRNGPRRTPGVDTSSGRIRPGKAPSGPSGSKILGRRRRKSSVKERNTTVMPAMSAMPTSAMSAMPASAMPAMSAMPTSAMPGMPASAMPAMSVRIPADSGALASTVPLYGDQAAGSPTGTKSARASSRPREPSSGDVNTSKGMNLTISLLPGGSPRGLTGLQNLGNTCFMNSCLQCLSNVPPLLSYLFSKQMAVQINVKSQSKGQLAKSLAELFKRMWTAKPYSAENPKAVKQLIGRVASRFSGYSQQDAQEFLRFLLDGLHADLNLVLEPPPYQELDISESLPDVEKSRIWWENYCQRNNSTVKNLFCGQLRSQVTCCTCNKKSTAFDPFWDLSIPIPKEFQSFGRSRAWRLSSISGSNSLYKGPAKKVETKKCSVLDCLKAFTQEEILEGNDAYYCSACKSHQKSTKRMCVFRLPRVLVVHIKRFSFGLNRRTKLTTEINIPLEDLDISGICAATKELRVTPLYDLVAVSNHMGGCFGGHYTADCLNQTTKKWYRFNDSQVSQISERQLDTAAAYLLFYLSRPSVATPTRHMGGSLSAAAAAGPSNRSTNKDVSSSSGGVMNDTSTTKRNATTSDSKTVGVII